MSRYAQWIALACDWYQSAMFDDENHTDGSRLAWICLLCYVKLHGRAGRAKVRRKTLMDDYRLSERSVDFMLKIARDHGAIELNDEVVTIVNWNIYQRDKVKGKASSCGETGQSSKKSTTVPNHPITQSPNHQTAGDDDFAAAQKAVNDWLVASGKPPMDPLRNECSALSMILSALRGQPAISVEGKTYQPGPAIAEAVRRLMGKGTKANGVNYAAKCIGSELEAMRRGEAAGQAGGNGKAAQADPYSWYQQPPRMTPEQKAAARMANGL